MPFPNPEEKKSQKVKWSSNPRKVRKIGERGKKAPEKLYQKSGCLGFFVEVQERKANRRNGKKIVCKDRKNSLGEKSRGEAMLSSACLRDSTASVHIFSAEQEQLRGKKCLVVLVGQKEGHMIRYGQKENKNEGEKIEFEK